MPKKQNKKTRIMLFIAFLGVFIFLIIKTLLTYNIETPLETRALPLHYIEYTTEKANQSKASVTFYDPAKAFNGYTLIDGKLVDMKGNEFPLTLGYLTSIEKEYFYTYDDGINNHWARKFFLNGSLNWQKKIVVHHDIETDEKNLWLLTRNIYNYSGRDVEFDELVELDNIGNEIYRWSTFDHRKEISKYHNSTLLDLPESVNVFNKTLRGVHAPYDYYHANAITVLPENTLGKKDKRFQKGNIMVSLHTVNLIIILDKDTKRIIWGWGPGEIIGQHKPIMSAEGNIFILDNGKFDRDYSRIIELNPEKKEIVWEYIADPPESFHTPFGGYIQLLQNGNVLVTESESGRVFEITKSKKVAWEWYNPIVNEEDQRKATGTAIRFTKEEIRKLAIIQNKGFLNIT